ncbi:phytanoyl-CoA dioxygenase family protein [Mycolicibacterium hippocampi]|uniref:Phytanoyl-CoA dioxygenase n=1 Tax=Mycolicibacterium hippocampi TaxID=659824 RepID=A0A7I9ZLL5_9MYCO|nr:phytanoyl-CoA dioxygenase family protein [Mycolicibacterium hippocampi]GFH01932.1 hypothetical protein MHIP_24150 [Mycolicibacterium hippocampi]
MIVLDSARMAKRGWKALRARGFLAKPNSDDVKIWMRAVRTDGVCVIPGFYDPTTCAELRREIENVAERFPGAVHNRSNGADRRIFGADCAAEGIRAFADEPQLLNAARTVLGGDATNAFTLAGMIAYREGNLGSGDGWHRDSFFNQFKAIVYLTDVTAENGPFEYILGSHLVQQKFSDHAKYGIPLSTSRIENESVSRLASAETRRHRVLTASMGTLVLADTTGIHRGMPLVGGERYALTNYYFPGKSLNSKTFDHFSPVLGRHIPVSVY